jgi:serine/threonine-protein kinase
MGTLMPSIIKSQNTIHSSNTQTCLTESTIIKHIQLPVQNNITLNHNLIDRILEKRWRIEKLIGEGGMGKIYLARDIRLSMRKVVVKIPDAEHLMLQAVRTLFEKEVDILIKYPHPSIVKVEDRGDVDGMPFVVLQFLEGGNLKDLITNDKAEVSIQEIFQWLFPVARALDFLHKENTLHCDVKPSNILFDKSGHAFLADFGIAKVLGQQESQPQQALLFSGTEKYMAPDTDPSPAYDQYSLGLVVLEALNGKIPNLKNRIQGISRNFIPNCSKGVQDVLLRALSERPDNRFESCLAFAHYLKGTKEERL